MIFNESMVQRESERADSYKLLSECYYLPDKQLLDKLNGLKRPIGELRLALSRCTPDITELESLRVDFARLFVGPFKMPSPPYGSLYLENTQRVMGDSTIDVKNRYRQEGLKIRLKEVPDHIAIELEFMYLLIFKEIHALKNADDDDVLRYRKKQLSFLNTHLGQWVPAFAKKAEANAETLFYQDLACLTKSFIEEDFNNLSEMGT